jgi:hypothetical protein
MYKLATKPETSTRQACFQNENKKQGWKDKLSAQVFHLRQMNLVLGFPAKTETARINCLLYSRNSFVQTGFSIRNRIFSTNFWIVLENQHNPIWKKLLSAIRSRKLSGSRPCNARSFRLNLCTLIKEYRCLFITETPKKPTINDKQ